MIFLTQLRVQHLPWPTILVSLHHPQLAHEYLPKRRVTITTTKHKELINLWAQNSNISRRRIMTKECAKQVMNVNSSQSPVPNWMGVLIHRWCLLDRLMDGVGEWLLVQFALDFVDDIVRKTIVLELDCEDVEVVQGMEMRNVVEGPGVEVLTKWGEDVDVDIHVDDYCFARSRIQFCEARRGILEDVEGHGVSSVGALIALSLYCNVNYSLHLSRAYVRLHSGHRILRGLGMGLRVCDSLM